MRRGLLWASPDEPDNLEAINSKRDFVNAPDELKDDYQERSKPNFFSSTRSPQNRGFKPRNCGANLCILLGDSASHCNPFKEVMR